MCYRNDQIDEDRVLLTKRMKPLHSETKRLHTVQFVLWAVLALNVLVALVKLGYGLLSHALGMQADGMHSLFDGVSNVIGLAGLWAAAKPPDENHPYGHKKFETLATLGIGLMLVTTCVYLIWRAYQAFIHEIHPQVTTISFAVMLVTMAINLGVTTWERQVGKQVQSEILLADSYHTASDLLTSLSVVLGLFAIQLGYPIVDPFIALAIAMVIGWTSLTVFKEVIRSLADEIRLDPNAIRTTALTLPGILDCHNIRTRGVSSHIFVDLSIHVQSGISIETAHTLANNLEKVIKEQFHNVEDVLVHVEPEGHH